MDKGLLTEWMRPIKASVKHSTGQTFDERFEIRVVIGLDLEEDGDGRQDVRGPLCVGQRVEEVVAVAEVEVNKMHFEGKAFL